MGNLLYDGVRIRLIDFEDAGASNRCFELANFAEHLGNRGRGLGRLADRFEVDRASVRPPAAGFVQVLPIVAGPGKRPADFAEQTERLLALLG